jgi:hypothetical protein
MHKFQAHIFKTPSIKVESHLKSVKIDTENVDITCIHMLCLSWTNCNPIFCTAFRHWQLWTLFCKCPIGANICLDREKSNLTHVDFGKYSCSQFHTFSVSILTDLRWDSTLIEGVLNMCAWNLCIYTDKGIIYLLKK